jgi:hypothetical protein
VEKMHRCLDTVAEVAVPVAEVAIPMDEVAVLDTKVAVPVAQVTAPVAGIAVPVYEVAGPVADAAVLFAELDPCTASDNILKDTLARYFLYVIFSSEVHSW